MNQKLDSHPRVALVYDRVNKLGGAERLLCFLHRLFPDAPLYTSVYDAAGAPWADGWDIRTSFLQGIPFLRSKHEVLAPFMPLAFESFDFSDFDVVISVSSEAAKGIITKPSTKHLCWLLTPTRYLWSGAEQYEKDFLHDGRQWLLPLYHRVINSLRAWDRMAAWRPDILLPISSVVAKRVEKYYQRKSADVLYPPLDTAHFAPADKAAQRPADAPQEPFFLIVSRLVPYKRIDTAIAACIAEKQHLVVIGKGSDASRLQSLAVGSPYIHFMGHLTDAETLGYYQACCGFLFPAEDDFGLTAFEALSCGKPVAVNADSGNAELLTDEKNAVLVQKPTVQEWQKALRKVLQKQWPVKILRQAADQISEEVCSRSWKEYVR